jgi:hypothetical protein
MYTRNEDKKHQVEHDELAEIRPGEGAAAAEAICEALYAANHQIALAS